jgi:hypothetical protein
MLMERHFVLDHRAAARPGFFMQGGRVSIGPVLTRAILAGGHPPKIHVLMRGIGNRKNAVRSAVLSWLFSAESRSPRKARACNVAFWRSDAVAVNGFNEDFVGWGLEDNEFFARLLNRGLRRRNLRHRAIAYHLDHLRDARDRVDRNQRLFDQTARTGASWCAMGLDQYLDDASGPDIGTDILPLRARRRAA